MYIYIHTHIYIYIYDIVITVITHTHTHTHTHTLGVCGVILTVRGNAHVDPSSMLDAWLFISHSIDNLG